MWMNSLRQRDGWCRRRRRCRRQRRRWRRRRRRRRHWRGNGGGGTGGRSSAFSTALCRTRSSACWKPPVIDPSTVRAFSRFSSQASRASLPSNRPGTRIGGAILYKFPREKKKSSALFRVLPSSLIGRRGVHQEVGSAAAALWHVEASTAGRFSYCVSFLKENRPRDPFPVGKGVALVRVFAAIAKDLLVSVRDHEDCVKCDRRVAPFNS